MVQVLFNLIKKIMAKFVGMIGTIRGKVGTVVFAKGENGVSYGKSYQPSVANPRTAAQLTQRAKVNAVGRISKAASAEMIQALGGSRRTNRIMFNSEMLKNAVVTVNNGSEYVASVAPEVIKFSKGNEVLHAAFSDAIVGANKITFDLTLRDVDLGGKYGERIVIGVIRPEDKVGVSYFLKEDVVFPVPSGEPQPISKEIYFPQDIEDDTMIVVWRSPFVISESGLSMISEGLYNDDNEIVAKLLTSPTTSFRGWGDSNVQLTEVFTHA